MGRHGRTEKARRLRRASVAAATVAPLLVLLGACGNPGEGAGTVTTTTTTTTTQKTTESPEPEPAARPAPTDAEVAQAFQAYIDERAGSGVMLAQAVTSVKSANGVVTVTLDADPVVLESSPFDNLAAFFGSPAAFNNDEGVWLRQSVQRVDVIDAAGQPLGSMTAAELNQRATGG